MIKKIDKLWGNEQILVNNERYCAKYLNLIYGYQCSLHYHKIKDETFYVLEGTIKLDMVDQRYTLKSGTSMRIHPGTLHRFTSLTETAKILEVSTTDYLEDSYRIEKSRKIEVDRRDMLK